MYGSPDDASRVESLEPEVRTRLALLMELLGNGGPAATKGAGKRDYRGMRVDKPHDSRGGEPWESLEHEVRRRDYRGRRISKPNDPQEAAPSGHEGPRRTASGRRIDKPFDPRRWEG